MSSVRRVVRLATFLAALFAIFGSIITFLGWLYPPSHSKEPNQPSPSPIQIQPVVIVQPPVVIVRAAEPTTSIPTTYNKPVPETSSPTVESKEAPLETQSKGVIAVNAHSLVSPKPRLSESSLGLLNAAGGGSHDSVKQWLTRGADPNAVSDYGKTSLMLAAENGHHDVCRTLIAEGALKDITDQRGRNALHYAAEGGHNDVVRFLLDHGVPAYAVDSEGNTPLALAQRGGNRTCAKAIEKTYR
jgi:hypothetical protein